MSKSDHFRKNAHAVIIGINEYEDPRIPNLAFARVDAESVYKVLIDPELGRFSPDNVIKLLDNDATERNIRTAIGRDIRRKAGNEDLVFIYFAGHGSAEIDPKCRYQDGIEKYLVPSDAELDNLCSTGIKMDRIQEFFGRIESKQVIFFIDSCYSGEAGGRTFQNPRFQSRAILDNEFIGDISGEGRFIVTACDAREVSLETKEIGHGLFTHYLIEGLKGSADKDRDGLVTINELYEYIYENVSQHARRVGGSMHPISKGSVKGKIFLSRYESEAQKKAKKLNAQAQLHFNAKKYNEAYELWQQVKKLLPEHEEAKQGIMEIGRIRDEEDRKRKKALEQKESVLLNLYHDRQLPVDEFRLGMELIGKSPDKLTEEERKISRLLEDLIKGKISVHIYLECVRLHRKKPESVKEPPESPENVRLPGRMPESVLKPPESPENVQLPERMHESVIEPPESSEKEDFSPKEDILSFEEAYSKGIDQYKSDNYKSALKLFKQASIGGHAAAMNKLGDMYKYGLGVKENYKEAVRWYKKSAKSGNIDAMNNLGDMYKDGLYVKQGYEEAERAREEYVAEAERLAPERVEPKKLTSEKARVDRKVAGKGKKEAKQLVPASRITNMIWWSKLIIAIFLPTIWAGSGAIVGAIGWAFKGVAGYNTFVWFFTWAVMGAVVGATEWDFSGAIVRAIVGAIVGAIGGAIGVAVIGAIGGAIGWAVGGAVSGSVTGAIDFAIEKCVQFWQLK